MNSRRDVLKSVAGAGVLRVLPEAAAQVPAAKVFREDEKSLAGVLADLIIPPTDTPGASAAGVPAFIKRELASRPELAAQFQKGLQRLDGEAKNRFKTAFGNLKLEQQTELLTSYQSAPATENGRFFRLLKDLVVDGYYTTQAGLVQELKWNGYRFMSEFPGCTHPEHKD